MYMFSFTRCNDLKLDGIGSFFSSTCALKFLSYVQLIIFKVWSQKFFTCINAGLIYMHYDHLNMLYVFNQFDFHNFLFALHLAYSLSTCS